MRTWSSVGAVVLITSLRLDSSGCFGGAPDILPRNGSVSVPSNGRITIARRSPESVSWIGPNGRPITVHERQMGLGPSAARILTSDSALPAGVHTIQTTGPDATQTFHVVSAADSLAPVLAGPLTLEAFNAPEPSSECPENIFIRARFPAPQDDRTAVNDLAYFVWIHRPDQQGSATPHLVLPAEGTARGEAFLRFGETGCGCIPKMKLEPGIRYQITLRAVDLAGHQSVNALSGMVTVPAAGTRQ